jgi:hypothetical protein
MTKILPMILLAALMCSCSFNSPMRPFKLDKVAKSLQPGQGLYINPAYQSVGPGRISELEDSSGLTSTTVALLLNAAKDRPSMAGVADRWLGKSKVYEIPIYIGDSKDVAQVAMMDMASQMQNTTNIFHGTGAGFDVSFEKSKLTNDLERVKHEFAIRELESRLASMLESKDIALSAATGRVDGLLDQIKRLRAEQSAPEPGAPIDETGIPNGNPFGTNVSDEQDAGEKPSTKFLWKPVREGDASEAAILFPNPYRVKSVTVNGTTSFRRNSLSNGWRSTWYGPKQSGPVKIVAEVTSDGGKTFETRTWSVSGSSRTDKADPGTASASTAPAPDPGTIPELGKYEMRFQGGLVFMSDHLAQFERKISSKYLQGKASNIVLAPGLEYSNWLIEQPGTVRHVFVRTANDRVYMLPATMRPGGTGDLKVRGPEAKHSYEKKFVLKDNHTINLASTQWLMDAGGARTSAPAGW